MSEGADSQRISKKLLLGDRSKPPADAMPIVENLPRVITGLKRWLLWKWFWKVKRYEKLPMDIHGDPDNWNKENGGHEIGVALAAAKQRRVSGLGMRLQWSDGVWLVVIDLDDCRNPATGEVLDWQPEMAAKWCNPQSPKKIMRLGGYWEVSPSGTGFRGIVRCEHVARYLLGNKGNFEAYSEAKYLTITGQRIDPETGERIDGSCEPAEVDGDVLNGVLYGFQKNPNAAGEHHEPGRAAEIAKPKGFVPNADQVINAMREAGNSEKFADLFDRGNISRYAGPSEADFGLIGMVAFWCGPRPELIDEVIRRSKLVRDKWDERRGKFPTLSLWNIDQCLRGKTEFYNWGDDEPPAPTYPIGNLSLAVTDQRRTPTKQVLTVELRENGEAIDLLQFSNVTSSRKEAAKRLLACLAEPRPEPAAVDRVLGAMLLEASKSAAVSPSAGLPEVCKILADVVPERVKLAYSVDGTKAYSSAFDEELSRSAFIERFTTNEIIGLACGACDAPRDKNDCINRPSLISMVEKELKLLWGDLISKLPTMDFAELRTDSADAVKFREAIIEIWCKAALMGISKQQQPKVDSEGRVSIQLAESQTLASKVRKMAAECGHWVPIHDAYAAYFRTAVDADGKLRKFLGMGSMLPRQMKVNIPGARDLETLRTIGEKLGAIDSKPPIPVQLTGGARMVVLSESLTNAILAEVIPDESAADDQELSQ